MRVVLLFQKKRNASSRQGCRVEIERNEKIKKHNLELEVGVKYNREADSWTKSGVGSTKNAKSELESKKIKTLTLVIEVTLTKQNVHH